MNPKTFTALENLNNWVDKIIEEGKRRDWDLADFVETLDIKSFQKFYREMIPYVQSLKVEIQTIDKLVQEFLNNEILLIENSKDKNILGRIISNWGQAFLPNVSINKLMLTLNEIRNNISNIIYQIKINEV